MKNTTVHLLTTLLIIVFNISGLPAQEIPLVYRSENTVSPTPVHLPSLEDSPVIETLPDPFAWSDGSGRSTRFETLHSSR
jgi:hypothetical protein